MTTRHAGKALSVLLALGLCCVLAEGCGVADGKRAEETLNLALAGLTGTDGLTFEGQAALAVDGRQLPEASVYYGGEMNDHHSLSLYTLLPDSGHSASYPETPSAASAGRVKPGGAKSDTYSKLEKRNGKWEVLPMGEDGGGNPLPGLNPIRQLEELEGVKKTVTNETGAGRGMRMLRIELPPRQAHDQLTAELEAEMAALKPVGLPGIDAKRPGAGTASGTLEPETLWKKENDELMRRLRSAEVTTIYHLKVDIRRGLPKSLSRHRTISYPSSGGKTRRETHVSRVDFYGYR